MAYGVILYKGANGKWWWRHVSGNGRVDAASEQGFATKWGAKRNWRRTHRGQRGVFLPDDRR
jgi:uncharacterized protein YegP (UPF0339 family)